MPYGQPQQLANLKPAWKPNPGRRSRDVNEALSIARKAAPRAVDLLASIVLDPAQQPVLRIKHAEIILKIAGPKTSTLS